MTSVNKSQNKKFSFIYVIKLMNCIKGYKSKFIIGTAVHMVHKIIPLGMGFCVSLLVSCVVTGHHDRAVTLIWISVALALLNSAFHYLDVLVSHDMAYRILADMRNMLYEKVDTIAPAAMDDKQSGDIISVILEDVELLEWFFAHTINQLAVAFIVPFVGLTVLCCFHWSIPLIVLIFILCLIMIPVLGSEESAAQGAEVREILGNVNADVVDGVQGLKDIISFGWEKQYFKRLFMSTGRYNECSLGYQKRAAGEGRMIQLLVGTGALVSNIFIISLSIKGNIDIQWLLPLMSMTSIVFVPIVDVLNMSTNYGSIFAAAERVFNVMQINPCVCDSGNVDARNLTVSSSAPLKIDVNDVYFRYPSRDKNLTNPVVFKGLNFSFCAGQSVALVGASGSGKTTIAKLIQRFWNPDRGSILAGGVDIRKLSIESLRDLITLVPQDIYLFNMSIRDNLLLANPSATENEIIEACKAAQANDFICSMPDGYDTIVGERAVRLSGGEKQRLAIAQAFLKDSPVIILDEATANLDSENERLINQAISSLKKGRATLIIAHRLSTIKSADKIVLINNGKNETEGTFEELIKSSLLFKNLAGEMRV